MSTNAVDPVDRYLGRTWGLVVAFSVATIALGVILLVWPKETVVVVAVLTGVYLVISGVFQLVASFASGEAGTGLRVLLAISGLLSVLLGIFAFRDLSHAVAILALLIGFGWLLRGIAELIEGLAGRGMPGRGWAITIGVLGIVAGIVVLVWPIKSLGVLVVVAGIWLVILGLVELVSAFALRKAVRTT